jgi:quercetin dioxygenase-like cupin family protein
VTINGFRHLRHDEIEHYRDGDWEFTPITPELTGSKQLMMGTFSTGPGMSIPPHHHTCDTIAYLVRGRAVFGSGDERIEMSPGDFVYVAAGVVHTEETIGDEIAEFVLARDNGGGETIPDDPEDAFWDQ